MKTALAGLYSARSGPTIEGNPAALELFARTLASGRRQTLRLDAPGQVEPYDMSLARIEIRPDDDLVEVSVRDKVLHIAGKSADLATVAAEIRDLALGKLGSHLHLEYHSGHPFFDPSTVPLVVSVTPESLSASETTRSG
jgi:hypothetical protein